MKTLHRDFITYAEEKSNNMSLKPTYYTLKEGGNWLRWPSNVKLNIDDLVKRDSFRVTFDSLEVHSIAFGEIAAGYNCFIRWDCRNGFTDEPSNIIY